MTYFKVRSGTSLVVQCLDSELPRQGAWVQYLVGEDPLEKGQLEKGLCVC